jgi:hypothetical protein
VALLCGRGRLLGPDRRLTRRCSRTGASVASLPRAPAAERLYRWADSMSKVALGTTWQHSALLGAGFSKNWGGYLAAEMVGAMLSDPLVERSDRLRRLLLEELDFEAALAEVRGLDGTGIPMTKGRRSKPSSGMRSNSTTRTFDTSLAISTGSCLFGRTSTK